MTNWLQAALDNLLGQPDMMTATEREERVRVLESRIKGVEESLSRHLAEDHSVVHDREQ